MHVDALLHAIPPLAVYVLCGLVVGVESIGVPLPGEIVLVGASLLAAQPHSLLNPFAIAGCAAAGAIIGDSIGYSIGRRYGTTLLERLGRRFPKHLGPAHLAVGQKIFDKHGVWAVLFGRFVAILRILAGPLAGAMRMSYPAFLAANATGAILWAGGTTFGIYALGIVAETWLKRFSWVGLVVAVIGGLLVSRMVRNRVERAAQAHDGAGAPDGTGHDSNGHDGTGHDGTEDDGTEDAAHESAPQCVRRED
ncbi:DedA family protein [Pseudonocardia phyllosphaerae]|uniref:DedA family protein n=1 Tax=Pseudonocardia phyllosphaerae TaxID=3390502 RepID=UPI0039782F27